MTNPPEFKRRQTAKRLLVGFLVLGAFAFIVPLCARGKHPKNIVDVVSANPKLQAATERAQKELDDFIAELGHPKPGEKFAINGAFVTPDGKEYLWIKDPSYDKGIFRGILAQQPIAYAKAKKGDPVEVARIDVFDWKIKDGDTTRGGYTEKVLSGG